jgi:hypothetical protein
VKKKRIPKSFDLVPLTREGGGLSEPYEILQELIRTTHTDLVQTQVVIVMQHGAPIRGVTAGRIKLVDPVQSKKTGDELEILLDGTFWADGVWSYERKTAEMDALLSQVGAARDKDDEIVFNDLGKIRLKRRPFTVETMTFLVRRHGLFSPEVERLARAFASDLDEVAAAEPEAVEEPMVNTIDQALGEG